MCDPKTYPHVNRPRFEGWKKTAESKGIQFVGDVSGELTWGPVPGDYSWNAVKEELTVTLNIASTESNCEAMYRDLGNMLPPKVDDAPVTPPGPAVSIDENGRYTVIGRVLRSGAVLEGVRVQAWDADRFGPDDKLGVDHTDDNGFFKISFDPSAFNDWGLDRDPDLYFKIFNKEGELIGETSGAVIKDAKPGQPDIVINLTR